MTALAPPARDRRTKRHTTRTVMRARELREVGWFPSEIRLRLAIEFGLNPPPSENTIRCWTERGFAEQRAAERRLARLRDRGTPDVLLALRVEDGLSYSAISKVARRFLGEDVDPETLRNRLLGMGVPKNPNKARVR